MSDIYTIAKLRGALYSIVNELKPGETPTYINRVKAFLSNELHDEIKEARAILEETRAEKLGDVTREPEDVIPNDTLTDAPAPKGFQVVLNHGINHHGVVSLHFAQAAEKLAQELCLHRPQELDSIPTIEIEMKLAVALQNVATQAVRDALSPAIMVKALEEHNAGRALDDPEDRRALAAALYEELLDRWRKST